jgi:predicted RNase H-like HicB family nuclease
MPQRTYAPIVHREGELFVAECSEVGTVSQGNTVEKAIANLQEATELYLKEFPPLTASDRSSEPLRGARATPNQAVFSFSITL